ncbi:DUF4856 domain-containing protein [Tenacibaculum maritimum]|uniref:DUF4856 domain-containing protein n=1 Tax=Tenacibaculum maritimum TaxID=107401 RepID=UPI0012E41A5A|nr:DUF4856 domain-containing protein [Tenacibaculum maritimum]MCD9585620.1 DUF4856 domain-containing protein [Tenacibaculum maritimum]MCD9611517.1 DUF4856 domain-containing protein [Tenacibaculum maritimum]CAA0149729.1 Probable lipoprotein precursor [Tenacibaculum maritimum]CAA0185809.1 Probable lipoprotein precursor [Tenacibaculum maritimum]
MKRVILSTLAISALVFTSCSSDDDTPINNVTAPPTYKFERNKNTTVSFSGQTARIKMSAEIVAGLKKTSSTKAGLMEMFKDGTGFTEAALNTSGKKVREKVAASQDYFKANLTERNELLADFDGWMNSQVDVVFPKWNADASKGNAGRLQKLNSNPASYRYVNAKGLELDQAFGKSLIGALMADQILNNYLSMDVLDAGENKANNDSEVLESGKSYTKMEHKWDEAFGYLYGTEENPEKPVLGADNFLNKYLSRVEKDPSFKGIAKKIYDAFKLGRAAIVAKNYEVRNTQAEIIREAISKVIAIRAVYYLQAGKEKLATDKTAAFHDLSEGYGFVYSLRFARNASGNPHLDKTKVKGYLTTLMKGDGFWDVTPETLDTISKEIAAAFKFTVAEAKDANN